MNLNPLFLCYCNMKLLFITFLYFLNVPNWTGCKQNGTKLGDVILPPWAKGDPREFIRVHREVMGVHFAVELGFHWVMDHHTKRRPWTMYHPVTNIVFVIFSYFSSGWPLTNSLTFWASNACQPVTETEPVSWNYRLWNVITWVPICMSGLT